VVDDGRLQILDRLEQARVLEVAGEYANYLVLREKAPEETQQNRAMQLLISRSRLGRQETFPPVATPSVRPDEGHAVARLGVGGGYEDNKFAYELQLRASYHDLMDPQQGYLDGAEIEFFSLRAKHFENDKLALEEFFPVKILSLAPIEGFRTPLSWKIAGGLVRKRANESRGKYVGQLRGGVGATLQPQPELKTYALFDAAFQASPSYEDKRGAVGVGFSSGLLFDASAAARVGLFADALRFGLGEEHSEFSLGGELRYTLSRDLALRLSAFRRGEFGSAWNGAQLMIHTYF
jgi:hypothetical protein